MSETGLLPALIGITAITLSAQPVQYTFSLANRAKISTAIVDPEGNVYFAGSTTVSLPTTPGAFQTTFAPCPPVAADPNHPLGRAGCSWGFIGKLSPAGTIVWLTYLPEPNGNSSITNIAFDRRRNVYVTGASQTVDGLPPAFPVTPGAFETNPQANGIFIAELTASGSGLVYATYFSKISSINTIFPDGDGNCTWECGQRVWSIFRCCIRFPEWRLRSNRDTWLN